MRLFAALSPSYEAVAALEDALPQRRDDLRWVPTEQWHLTTAFYGDVDESVVPDLVDRLTRAASRAAPMALAIRGVGTFPRQSGKARVLWAGIEGDVAELTRLAERCIAAGRRCGLAMEDRPYRPHLTLARARREPVDLRDVVAALSSYAGPPWQATSLRLVKSTLGAQVIHETVTVFPLEREGSRERH